MSIKVTKLNHIYDKGMPTEQKALTDVSFEIADGELVGIIGHTGSGKSTLLQHLNGLLKASSGSIEIGGTDITRPGVSMVEIRKKVGLVFQYPEYQLFEVSVAKDVAYGPGNLGLSQEEIDKRVREAIALVGLDYEKVKDRSPFELSGGQKRAVAIAGVVAMKPEVLILDEPTAGLDPRAHKDILRMIREVHEKTGNITILVSHNMGDVAEMADKVMVIDGGKLVIMGTPEEVFSQG
ncbi:MAG: energy-coupling factor transporter ATPase, partial [Firmicutes bacterium]|nr:energy-coupling factor transporter ATPase [Bacillota bacterium]